jgi:hypothetical protein
MADDPMTPQTVRGLIDPVSSRRFGTTETAKSISAALSYLKSQGKVKSVGRDEWVLDESPNPYDAEVDPDDVPF